MIADLNEESLRATKLLEGLVVKSVVRHRQAEVLVEFTNGSRLYVDANGSRLEMSITGGNDEKR